MKTFKDDIEHFFDEYAARYNAVLKGKTIDIDGTVNSFAECFIESSPVGIICSKNDNKFREAIPQGYAFYKSIGTVLMKINSKEVNILDDLHALVSVHWHAEYLKEDNNTITIDFDVFYLLQRRDDNLKIFAYITGNEQKVLKENGLIPK